MNIAYDARSFPVNEKFDGVGRYSYELAHAMAAHKEHEFTWLISDERQIDKLPSNNYLVINRADDMLREVRLPKRLNSFDFDVVYSPFYTMGAGMGKRQYRLVLTIHDMIYFTYRTPPQWLPTYQRIGWWLFNLSKWPTRKLLNSADVVATVSQSVVTDLQRWHMTVRPITPVLNAVSEVPVPDKIPDHAQSNDIVYMGAFTPYKNVECLIDAMAGLVDCKLHLLSRIPPKRREQLEQHAREKGVRNIVLYDGVSDEKYHELLQNARCLVTASKAEGFGLAILEAQALGVPVACSDIPIFHEVAGDAAVYFDPKSPTDCASAIRSLADDTASTALIQKGFENAPRFRWNDSAEAAIGICETLQNNA